MQQSFLDSIVKLTLSFVTLAVILSALLQLSSQYNIVYNVNALHTKILFRLTLPQLYSFNFQVVPRST